ncbi:hypothetical protein PGTUg99_004003 [Puccinia graminis f. sp. tritici]|uniref:RING-type E3 ubiquitin transferase n=2 Tax=Puccinia graminis f. sp. tritici TaxID=56615 RepID=E3KBM1_PUCGT|nr:uncharacterized protein PGTG_07755 [Puccinia graminis f. sp. tritici CRL 75-36-700-3]EFP81506.2 hypothetical protein PGTG_07755 [Puccinia graminis f. sp. tritici CRL 75-36-700-3]KAA1130023.1 hypothetical protein PGTUg99_004003 [Puccinia graminis f. sp. tritici]
MHSTFEAICNRNTQTNIHEDAQEGGDNQDQCAICLDLIINQAVIVPCQHSEYCFRCMRIWTTTSNRCPICVQPIDHLVHRIDPRTKDFQIFHPLPIMPNLNNGDDNNRQSQAASPTLPAAQHPPNSESGPSSSQSDHFIGLDRRQFIYRHSLYAKHIPSNRYTQFYPVSSKHFLKDRSKNPSEPTRRDCPSAKLIARTIRFLQRELRAIQPEVLAHPIEHSIRVIIIILHRADSNSSEAVHLFSQLIRDPQLAQHFSHELTCFLRSPYDDLLQWDQVLQYPTAPNVY